MMITKQPGFEDTTNGLLVGHCSKCRGELRATLMDYIDLNPRQGTCSQCGNVEPAQWAPNLNQPNDPKT